MCNSTDLGILRWFTTPECLFTLIIIIFEWCLEIYWNGNMPINCSGATIYGCNGHCASLLIQVFFEMVFLNFHFPNDIKFIATFFWIQSETISILAHPTYKYSSSALFSVRITRIYIWFCCFIHFCLDEKYTYSEWTTRILWWFWFLYFQKYY